MAAPFQFGALLCFIAGAFEEEALSARVPTDTQQPQGAVLLGAAPAVGSEIVSAVHASTLHQAAAVVDTPAAVGSAPVARPVVVATSAPTMLVGTPAGQAVSVALPAAPIENTSKPALATAVQTPATLVPVVSVPPVAPQAASIAPVSASAPVPVPAAPPDTLAAFAIASPSNASAADTRSANATVVPAAMQTPPVVVVPVAPAGAMVAPASVSDNLAIARIRAVQATPHTASPGGQSMEPHLAATPAQPMQEGQQQAATAPQPDGTAKGSVARVTADVAAASSAASSAAAAASQAANAAAVASVAAASAANAARAATPTPDLPLPASASTEAKLSANEKKAPLLVPPPSGSSSSVWWHWLATHSPQTAAVLQGFSFAMIVKVMCMAGNVLVQVSPYPQVLRWEKRGCTGEADAAPYVSIAFGGWQWCFYGMFAWLLTKRSGFLILVHSNCLGAILGTYYTIIFCRYCNNTVAFNSFQGYLSAVASLVVLQICTVFVLPSERALFLSGLVASFCSFVGAISMLVTVPAVVRTRDSRSIPGPLVCANLLSSVVWCVCGWMLQDLLVAGPNVIAALASVLCIYLKYLYKGDGPEVEDGDLNVAFDGLLRSKPSVRTAFSSYFRPELAMSVGGHRSSRAAPSRAPTARRSRSAERPAPAEHHTGRSRVNSDAALLLEQASSVETPSRPAALMPRVADPVDTQLDCECGTGGTW